jgi:UDP-3-O-[3-hydroxymyristoyl] N-acetylglucosamine deacetylase
VISQDRVLNAEGLRFVDEFVRHKALDAIGDLALAGLPLIGAYRSVRGGHKLNHAVLCALMADPTAWTTVDAVSPPSLDANVSDLAEAQVKRVNKNQWLEHLVRFGEA